MLVGAGAGENARTCQEGCCKPGGVGCVMCEQLNHNYVNCGGTGAGADERARIARGAGGGCF
eukprot:366227-Chlamydomonas_euryale.AAC.24